ncbi:fatty acid desaturase family protein [Solimonas marina]|uniref:Fatty acid desaturase n=1 Tax=Solimonas marina TaxID=2714601 RepID=A0A970B3M7_9GAMM|nr:fatty acid desaturase [Solimonas marina]NKF21427.1 fatty acid desaturase [Solimonas marina]
MRLMQFRPVYTHAKIGLFIAIMVALALIAWHTPYTAVRWLAYFGLGYMQMGMVTFMHDATHNVLFKPRWENWAFGILAMMPLLASFVAFKEDHLEHHRYNRSYQDPDAFTMGRRRPLDFVLFYGYVAASAPLSFLHFNLLYPIGKFGLRNWAIHLFETALKIVTFTLLFIWAAHEGVLGKAVALLLCPVLFFSLLNAMRFIAEHYETPWDEGKLTGTRTVLSNPVHSWFWNNINYHIGHHVFPRVPYYNLVELHRLIEPDIDGLGALVDRSYLAVFGKALWRGPESEARLKHFLDERGRVRKRAEVISRRAPVAG